MTMIVTGVFRAPEQGHEAVMRLIAAGIDGGAIAEYYVSPSGHHSVTLDGHGRGRSVPDTEGMAPGAAGGATAGVLAGAVAGAATIPLTGPIAPAVGAAVGAVVGAYVGSLAGALGGSSAREGGEGHGPRPVRQGGPAVSVAVSTVELEEAMSILSSAGALEIERSEGEVVRGRLLG